MAASCQVRVLSFNTWGIYYVASTKMKERIGAIAQELRQFDIVGLQEVWKREDFLYLAKELEHVLPYHHYFHSGIIGSGLCVFSRYPIMAAYTHSFSVCGSIRYLQDGEIFSGKGIMMCRVLTPSGPLAFYTTHTDPRYRESQVFEMYKFVEQTRGGDPIILTGDYNTDAKHPCYNFLTTTLHLSDVYSDNPEDTCNRISNVFTKKNASPARIDFIFYSDKLATSLALVPQDHRLALTGPIPGKDLHYSDHEGVEATFQVEPKMATFTPAPRMDDSTIRQFRHLAEVIHGFQSKVKTTPKRIIIQWVVLGVVMLLLAPLLEFLVRPFLAAYGLGWVLLVVMSCVGALVVFRVIITLVNAKTSLALEANLCEIRTLLKYNSAGTYNAA